MRVTRRGFFQTVGVATGTAALIKGKLAKAEQAGEELTRWATPEEVMVPSVCQQCPGGCGLMVRTLDGEVAGLSGNPLHPINRGALCPKAFGGLQLLYDPNRLKGPMARAGERGRFRSIGWDEALSMLTARLADLRAKGLSHTVAILGGQYRGYRDTLWKRFAEAYGTPNYIRVRCLPPEKPALAHQLMQGVTTPLSYDLGEAQFILSFGAGLLEAWLGPVHVSQAFARLRRSGERPRGRFVQVDPRRSPTAVKADRWVPIVPGTDGILALGIANALLREELYDKEFIERHTFGFDDWVDQRGEAHEGFKNFVLREYGLITVSTATGVPVRTILEIARDLGTTKPAVVVGERGAAYGPDDLHTRMAIHSLNALVGSIGVRGGLLIQGELPLSPLRPVQKDEAAARGLEHPRIDGAGRGEYFLASDAPQALPERILSATPYPINALLLFATNPLANHPAKEAFARAFDRIPFIVSFSPFLDESSSRADLILPDHTYLERWQDDQVTHLAGFTCFSLARPAAVPLQQTRNTADVVLQIATATGGSVAKNLPWRKFEDFLFERVRGLYEAGRGYVVSAPAEESLRKILERQGYWTPEFKSYDEFWVVGPHWTARQPGGASGNTVSEVRVLCQRSQAAGGRGRETGWNGRGLGPGAGGAGPGRSPLSARRGDPCRAEARGVPAPPQHLSPDEPALGGWGEPALAPGAAGGSRPSLLGSVGRDPSQDGGGGGSEGRGLGLGGIGQGENQAQGQALYRHPPRDRSHSPLRWRRGQTQRPHRQRNRSLQGLRSPQHHP
ncbi:MAG: Molybdopterin oxidoreductase Fe4S4 region, partial [candidate division NC10 bacterium]|nr:Molybdopterin oxidoreductase Fe4S4 region [candidate division NC10 bacterium]